MARETRLNDDDTMQDRRLTRKAFLKSGAVASAGVAAMASPLGAYGAALARHSVHLAGQSLDATQPITLRFMTRGPANYLAFFKAASDAFTKLHPNVNVKIELHQDIATVLKVQIAAGSPPDLAFWSDDLTLSLAVRGGLLDLAPFFKRDGLRYADFWTDAIMANVLGDHLFGMPLDYIMHLFAYNKALFDQQHLRYPSDNWTWNDFVQLGRHLTLDRNGKRASEHGFQPEHVVQYADTSFGFLGSVASTWFDVLDSFGGDMANADLTKATLDTPTSVAAFQFMADLGNKYYTSVTPKYPTARQFAIEQGNAAMCLSSTNSYAYYASFPRLKWQQGNIDVVPLPLGKKRAVIAEASPLVIPRGTQPKNVPWAWEFIKFMTVSDPGQRLSFKYSVSSIPNLRRTTPELLSSLRLPTNHGFVLKLLPQATKVLWYSEVISGPDLESIMSPPFSTDPDLLDLFKGSKTAAQAMPLVNRRVQALLDSDQALMKKYGMPLHNR